MQNQGDPTVTLRKWLKFQKIHKSMPLPPHLQMHDDSIPSSCFQVIFSSIENLQKRKTELSIKYFLNLWDSQESQFFGRTYESNQLPLIFQPDGKQLIEPICVCFHMRQSNDVQIVAEVMLFESDDNEVIVERRVLGWGQMAATTVSNGSVKMNLKMGSCRVLSGKFKQQPEATQYYLKVEVQEISWFNSIKTLLPEGCLCGSGDELMGTKNKYLPKGILEKDQLSIVPEQLLFVQAIEVSVPTAVENEVRGSVVRYREVKYNASESDGQIVITARRLVVAAHNGWTFTNRRGQQNFCALDEGHLIQQIIEGESVEYRVSEFKGTLDVNNHGDILVFQLEYDSSFVVTNMGRQYTTVYSGWFPLVIQQDEDFSFEEDFITGPGRTLSGKTMLDLSIFPYPIVVSGKVGGFNGKEVIKQHPISKFIEQPEEQDQQSSQRKSLIDGVIREMQEEHPKTQEVSFTEYEKQLEELRKREEQYHLMLKQMQDNHDEEIKRQSSQYDDLKQMMKELSESQQQQTSIKIAESQNMQKSILTDFLLHDQSDLEKWRIMESMTSVPRRTFYGQKSYAVEAAYGNRNISRGELAYFSSKGVKGLVGGEDQDSGLKDTDQSRCIDFELQDLKQSSLMLVQFLGFQPRQEFVNQVVDDKYTPQSIYSEEASVPNRVVFTIHFFDFPPFNTDPLVFENAMDRASFQETLRKAQPLVFLREAFLNDPQQYKEPVYKFEIEPSQSQYPQQFQHFSKYLFQKCMTIEMWDYDSQQLFGAIKIPLRNLLRQQKIQSVITRQVDIVSPTLRKIMGTITVMVKNVGKNDRVQEYINTSTGFSQKKVVSFKREEFGNKTTDLSNIKKKVVSSQGMKPQIEQQKTFGNVSIQQDSDDRIKERIRRFKIGNHQEVNMNENTLKDINQLKDQRKQALVKSVLQDHISDEQVIHAQMGRAEIFQLDFKNPNKNGQTFSIVIDDPDYIYTHSSELMLVHNPSEWKYLVHSLGHQAPFEYTMIKVLNDPTQFTFFLNENESVSLLFKIIFYRDPDTQYSTLQNVQDILTINGNDYVSKYCYPRQLAIYINLSGNGQTVGGSRIKFYPHVNFLDHIYRFYERDNHKIKITFPPIFGNTLLSRDALPILHCTDPNIQVEWNDKQLDPTQQLVVAHLRVPKLHQELNFRIFAYGDSYQLSLMGNWVIHVTSLSGLVVEVPLGQVQASKLTLHSEIARQVRFYSSHPLTLWFATPFDRSYSLAPGKINAISITIRQFSEQTTRVIVTCVDIISHELVYSWVVGVTPTIPSISLVFDVKCPSETLKNFVLPYSNKSNSDKILVFVSSHPDLLQIQESSVLFRALERQDIRVRIQRKGDIQCAEVKVYVGDQNATQETHDCLLFRIQFIYE